MAAQEETLNLPDRVCAALDGLLPEEAGGQLCIAFSGGLDSSVLLHALAQALADHPRYTLRAVYIDHQLQADSARWGRHCAAIAARLGVPCVIERVSVTAPGAKTADGLQAAARRARYQALREMLSPGEALLTAHHADDQLETVLLALMRGAGLGGLSAMPPCRRFGPGWHIRPMLDLERGQIEAWARAQALEWIEDPSNRAAHFERNYLRHWVVPALRRQWPAAARTAARSAAHVAEAAALVDELAMTDLATAADGRCLRVAALAGLSPARRRNLLRHWVKLCGARPPATRKLAALEHDMLSAAEDRNPCVAWDGWEVRRHRGLLYCEPALPPLPTAAMSWRWSMPLQLPAGTGRLAAVASADGGLAVEKLPDELRVCLRGGGEALRPQGHAHRRKLKKLLQTAHVLPWWRGRIPLVYAGETLIAVGDLWMAREFAAEPGAPAVRLVWEGRPQIQATAAARRPFTR